ncbi:hypothetical protein pdul_cds_66 [Pandoravirus dulcis]|uniref:Uncharacterized protein n=1 Tax=Pandoravirus dulcis TaxID=1349409 RepID=S4VVH3_9VIRU|nr:hypothetical protein pdul_cds_66 [Pandoravirus dulcis]AGO81954.2 hypothetical protein pdul_cds_66 [Pandoravirus dulcis]
MSRGRVTSVMWRACRTNLPDPAEAASVSAFVMAPTRDGHLGRMTLTAVYAFRGRAARRAVTEERARDWHKRMGIDTDRGAEGDGHAEIGLEHTWWPRDARLCALLSSVCREAAFATLYDFDADALAAPDVAKAVADAAGGHVRRHMADWGALSMAVLARAWPVVNDDPFAASLQWRALVPTMSSPVPGAPASIVGVPDADDAEGLRDFNDLVSFRDAALKCAVVAGVGPYSYDGVRAISRSLRRFEEPAVYHERPALLSGLKAMRHQLYASAHRL